MTLAENLFPWDTVVKILGLGLSGLGFLLMYLSYQLINRVMAARAPNSNVFSIIKTYMLLCFVMTITVGAFTIINTIYKNDTLDKQQNQLVQQSQKISNTTTLLAANQKSNTVDTLIKSHDKITPAVKTEQKKALDTIGKFVAKTNKKPLIDSFNRYRAIIVSTTDQLTKIDTSTDAGKAKFTAKQKQYQWANTAVNRLTNHVATALIRKQ